MSAGTLAAGCWKYYDIATNSFSANLATTNLPATLSTDSSFLALDEAYVPFDADPGDGYFGNLTATATAATSITGQAAGGDAAVLANEYRNFQIRIVQDTVTPTAVGQRRNITSHTAGASPVYTVPAWTVTPSANAVVCHREQRRPDPLLGVGEQQHVTRTTSPRTRGTRPRSPRALRRTLLARSTARRSSCVRTPQNRRGTVTCTSSVAARVATMDLFDIAGAATGAWTAAVVYGGSGMTFTTGTTVTPDPYTGGGRFAFINPNGLQRCLKFDVKNRVALARVLPPVSLRHGGGRPAHVHGDVRGRRDEARLHHPPAHGRRGVLRDGRPEVSHVAPPAVQLRQDDPRTHRDRIRPRRRDRTSGGPPAHGGRDLRARRGQRGAGVRAPRGRYYHRPGGSLRRDPGSSKHARDRERLRQVTARLAVLRSLGAQPRVSRPPRTVGPCWPAGWLSTGTSTVLGRASCVSVLAGLATGWSRVFGLMLSARDARRRTVRVRPEARAYRPAHEDRCMSVRPEARTMRPAAQDRTIRPQRENRSIDA